MLQENTNTQNLEMNIEEVAAQFCSLEPDFNGAKALRERLRTQLIDYAKAQKEAFTNNEKSYHIPGGVVVRRASKTVGHYNESKMNSAWLKAILATPSAAAITVAIDPKKLLHDEETALLLNAIEYTEENRHSYKVEVDE